METIGRKIKRLRDEKKWTQQDLADKIGVSFTTISLYEFDARKPSFNALYRIAEVFDVTPEFFFNGEEIKNEKIKLAARNMQELKDEDIQAINTLIKSLIKKAKDGE